MAKLFLINRYSPPSSAVSAEYSCLLLKYLSESLDIDINICSTTASYDGKKVFADSIGTITRVTSPYSGRNKIIRLFASLWEGYRLIHTASKNADIIISMTEPSLLNLWASVLCKRKKIPWIYWSFDLYPDAFMAAGLISSKNMIYRLIDYLCYSYNTPFLIITLGENQAKYLSKKFSHAMNYTVLPCGIHHAFKTTIRPDWYRDDNKVYFAYIGNMGEAHSEKFIVEFIRRLNPLRHRFILSTYGSKADKLIEHVKTQDVVTIVDSVNRDQLAYIDVHLVTLLPDWNHICVPSKAVSAVCSGASLVFHGSPDSDTWQILKDAAWLINDSDDLKMFSAIENVIEEASSINLLRDKKQNALSIRESLFRIEAATMQHISNTINTIVKNSDDLTHKNSLMNEV